MLLCIRGSLSDTMFKKNGSYSRLASQPRRSDYAQYSAESGRDGGGQTFHFSALTVDDADDELLDQDFELRSRGSGGFAPVAAPAAAPQPEYVTHDVVAEDTLQSISLKYSTPVAELKRANNIFTEKELYARRFIKIPVGPHSLLTADPPTEELVSLASSDSPLDASGRGSPASAASTEVRPFGDGVHEGNKLLKNVDRELSVVRAQAERLRAEGVLSGSDALAADAVPGSLPPRPAGICSCSGADYGLQWICLLVIALVVLAVIPVWYIMREYETDQLGNHHTSTIAATSS